MHCFIHIGPPKTGSTSIQDLLVRRRKQFIGEGIFVPNAKGHNMSEFAYTVIGKARPTRDVARHGITESCLKDWKRETRQKFSEQLRYAKRRGCHSAIISSEALSRSKPVEIDRLKSWLSVFFDEFTIIPVLRRQDKTAVSRYKNRVKNAGFAHRDCLATSKVSNFVNLMKPWETTFGEGSMRPLLLGDAKSGSGDILEDFCQLVGATGIYDRSESEKFRSNVGIDGRGIELLRVVNLLGDQKPVGVPTENRVRLEKILARGFGGPTLYAQPSREQAEKYYDIYRESNEVIRAKYFPHRKTLFDENFSSYPDEPFYPTPDIQYLLKVIESMISIDI